MVTSSCDTSQMAGKRYHQWVLIFIVMIPNCKLEHQSSWTPERFNLSCRGHCDCDDLILLLGDEKGSSNLIGPIVGSVLGGLCVLLLLSLLVVVAVILVVILSHRKSKDKTTHTPEGSYHTGSCSIHKTLCHCPL